MKKPNLDVWLKGICGDTIRVDRINREPDYIRNPALSMIISAQPGVLSEIMQNSLLDGRGFLARLLYINIPSAAMPKSFQSAPIPTAVQEDYDNLIFQLLNLSENEPITEMPRKILSGCQRYGAGTELIGTARIYLAGHSGLFRRRTPVSGENLCQSSSFER